MLRVAVVSVRPALFIGQLENDRRGRFLKLAEAGLASTGHDELSLLALSVGDYGNIQRLLQTLMQYHRDRAGGHLFAESSGRNAG